MFYLDGQQIWLVDRSSYFFDISSQLKEGEWFVDHSSIFFFLDTLLERLSSKKRGYFAPSGVASQLMLLSWLAKMKQVKQQNLWKNNK